MLASSVTSQGSTSREPTLSGQRADPLLQRLALVGEGQFGTLGARPPAMPQAMERSLATPMTRPLLPAIIAEKWSYGLLFRDVLRYLHGKAGGILH